MKRVRLSLFWKFTLAIVFIVGVFGSINAFLIWRNVYGSLEREVETRGQFIAKSVAAQAAVPLMYDDVATVQRMVEDVVKIDPRVAYAFIVDGRHRVVAHTFETGIPSGLLAINRLDDATPLQSVLLAPKNFRVHLVRDIAVPVIDRTVGTVRIGLEEETIRAEVFGTIKTLLIMVGVFLAAGIAGAFVFAQIITSPIRSISTTADLIDLDALRTGTQPRIAIRQKLLGRWRFWFRAEDEIDQLTEHFNRMIDRLEDAYASLRSAQASLLQSEKLASIGTLAAGIAHEVNNPLAGLRNCIRRLSTGNPTAGQKARYLALMDEASEKIERVVQRLLNFTRKHELRPEPVDIAAVIENALVLVGYRLESARITIEKVVPPVAPVVYGSAN